MFLFYVSSISNSYLNPEPQTLLSELNQRMAPQFQKLNKALIELVSFLIWSWLIKAEFLSRITILTFMVYQVDQYSMVSFVPLDLRKESR